MHKRLTTLAAVGLDVRHHDLLAELATRLIGPNAFVRAALLIAASVATTVRLDARFALDPARTALAADVVRRQVNQLGGSVRPEVIQQLEKTFGFTAPPAASAGDDWQASEDMQEPIKMHLG